MQIPAKGMDADTIFETLETFRGRDISLTDGKTWGYVYDAGQSVDDVRKKAFANYLSENALDPTVFPSVIRLETDIIKMMLTHVNAPEGATGNFTSGGTESNFLAVKTARERFRALHPEGGRAEIVLPETAHASFFKAAHYLDMKAVIIPVDARSFKADVDAAKAAITSNTALLVGSAPSYAHGVIDPIEALGQLAIEHNVMLHVDSCIGFHMPYFKRLGARVPKFDLSVPGVSTISMDLHKYAFAGKGASTLLYSDASLRRHQIYACATWSGYTLVNNTIQSTRSAGPMAAAWAVLNFVGDEGYIELSEKMLRATRRFIEGIEGIEGIRLLGQPESNLIGIASDTVNVFHIIDEMKLRGWNLQAQLSFGVSPRSIHLSINPSADEKVDALLEALKESVDAASKLETSELAGMIKDGFASIDPNEFDEEMFSQMLGMAGMTGVALPERMAEINEVMDALPTALREKLLVEFLHQLYLQ